MTLERGTLWAAVIGAVGGLTLAAVQSSCATPSQDLLDKAAQHTLTGTRIAACVESVLAEEDRARELAHRLAETAAELEADRIRSAAREPSSETSQEIDKVLRDGGTK